MSTTEITQLDLDWDVLGHLADPVSVDYLRSEQVTTELIEDVLVKEVLDWQFDHVRSYGHAATGSVIEDQFADATISTPLTVVGDLVERLRERYVRNQGRTAIRKIYERAYEDPLSVAKDMQREGRRLADLTVRRGEFYGTGDYDRWFRAYEAKKRVGLGPSLGYEDLDAHFNGQVGVTFLIAAPKTYKALALDTPIPTPQGWKTMGDLEVGDQVFSEEGSSCSVVGKSQVWTDRPCYTVTFSDGAKIIADEEHLWETRAHNTRRNKNNGLAVRTTKEILNTLRRIDGGCNHSISVAGSLHYPEKDLLIDSYTLGAWLGDGTSREGVITGVDEEIFDRIRQAGYTVRRWPSSEMAHTVLGLKVQLRQEGLLDNKHIPIKYLQSSNEQRLRLLQGLMDTDGTCTEKGESVLVTCNPRLRDDSLELIRSLGLKPVANEYRAMLGSKDCGPKWHIRFNAYSDTNVFGLMRKASKQKARPLTPTRSATRQITSIEKIVSTPVQCIAVDSPSHLYLAGKEMVPTHNSWFTTNAVVENVARGKTAYLYPLELPADEATARFLCMAANVPYWRYLKGMLTDQDQWCLRTKEEELQDKGLFKIEKPKQGQRGVQFMVERAINAGADCIFIDQLQYIEARNGHSLGALNNTGDYFEVVNDLRNYSDEIPIFVVHQFNRCFVPGTPVTLADGTRVAIEAVTNGTQIITRGGEIHPVVDCSSRHYAGAVMSLRGLSKASSVTCTPNHHMWAMKSHNDKPEWIEAGHLSKGDWLEVGYADGHLNSPKTLEYFRMAGLYLAEGSVSGASSLRGKKLAVQRLDHIDFTFHIDERAYADFVTEQCILEFGAAVQSEDPKKTTRRVTVNRTAAAKEFYTLFGKGAANKRVPASWMTLESKYVLEILVGWLCGDGHVASDYVASDQVVGVTISKALVYQMQQIALRCGFACTVATHPKGKNCARYSLIFSGSAYEALRPYLGERRCGHHKHNETKWVDGRCFTRLARVTREAYSGLVHDLSVEGEHSYLANGYTVHNSVMNSKGMPEMQQVKGSAAIEEVATLMMGLWASKEMRQDNEINVGTLASRNYSYMSWKLGIHLTKGCEMRMLGVVEEDEEE